MKKLILAILAVSSFATAQAQEGTILVYGNVSYASDKQVTAVKNNNWAVNPGVGYSFTDNITAGLQGSFMKQTFGNVGTSNKRMITDWTGGAFFRYTKNFTPMFYYFGQLDASFAGGRNELQNTPPTANYNGVVLHAYPALGVNIGHMFAINFSFGGIQYSNVSWTNNAEGIRSENKLAITFGQQVQIGLSKTFCTAKCKASCCSKDNKKEDKEDAKKAKDEDE